MEMIDIFNYILFDAKLARNFLWFHVRTHILLTPLDWFIRHISQQHHNFPHKKNNIWFGWTDKQQNLQFLLQLWGRHWHTWINVHKAFHFQRHWLQYWSISCLLDLIVEFLGSFQLNFNFFQHLSKHFCSEKIINGIQTKT